MMIDARMFRCLAALSMIAIGACAGDTPLATSPETGVLPTLGSITPRYLSVAPGAPLLATTQVQFYAVRGEDREVFVWYAASPGAADSSKLLRFRVPRRSLCNRPDGTLIAQGDSLLITLTVVDPTRQVVQFAPAGLTFCPGRPAKLTMWYHEADVDFDDDGDIDAADEAVEQELRIWRQANDTAPWHTLVTDVDTNDDQLEADLTSFSNYVVAY